MKRTNIFWFVLNSLFLIVFNTLFFLFQDIENSSTTVWISYGFIHFSYLLLLATPLLIRSGKAQHIYSRSLFAITTTYFILELIVGIAFIIQFPENLVASIITQVILTAIFIAWLLSNLIANEHINESVERREIELQYVKESASRINFLLKQITDTATNKKVEKLYDLIRSSQSKSNYQVYQIEQDIVNEIGMLENAVRQNNIEQINTISDKIYNLAEDRNRQLRKRN